jgi:uncharacterized protein
MKSEASLVVLGEPSAVGAAPNVSTRIGVLGDTHGYLDDSILDVFAGVDLILHAGDIGDPQILERLRAIAPVMAVAGNLDARDGSDLPTELAGVAAGVRFALGHKRKRLTKRLVSDGQKFDLVVFGHDHVPSASWVDGTLWLNPGSASAPYEEDDGPTVAVVEQLPTGLGVRFAPVARVESRSQEVSAKRNRAASTGA